MGTLAADTNILTVDNFPLFLFDEIRLKINGKVIDSIKNVEIHAMMKGVLVTSKNAENYTTLHGWYKNDHLLEKGQTFCYCIPLKMCLGIAHDYEKAFINSKIEVVCIHSRVDNNWSKLCSKNKYSECNGINYRY